MLTVLILAAGYGRRMGPFSRMVNKALIPYDNKPLISHIMEKFDVGTHLTIQGKVKAHSDNLTRLNYVKVL